MLNLPRLTSTLIATVELTHRLLFQILASSTLPNHISFILDENRRYSRKFSLPLKDAYRVGFLNVVRILRYCAELDIPYISIFAFSIDNFRRTSHEIHFLMSLIQEKLKVLLDDIAVINDAGISIHFVGDLDLIDPEIRDLERNVEEKTKGNDQISLLVCLAYSSRNEMVRGVRGVCEEERGGVTVGGSEKGMYMTGYPEPNLLVRMSGEWRMSNFLLWHSRACMLRVLHVTLSV